MSIKPTIAQVSIVVLGISLFSNIILISQLRMLEKPSESISSSQSLESANDSYKSVASKDGDSPKESPSSEARCQFDEVEWLKDIVRARFIFLSPDDEWEESDSGDRELVRVEPKGAPVVRYHPDLHGDDTFELRMEIAEESHIHPVIEPYSLTLSWQPDLMDISLLFDRDIRVIVAGGQGAGRMRIVFMTEVQPGAAQRICDVIINVKERGAIIGEIEICDDTPPDVMARDCIPVALKPLRAKVQRR